MIGNLSVFFFVNRILILFIKQSFIDFSKAKQLDPNDKSIENELAKAKEVKF